MKLIKELVLINDVGCEIAREEITEERTEDVIVNEWTIYAGDRIEVVERLSEC